MYLPALVFSYNLIGFRGDQGRYSLRCTIKTRGAGASGSNGAQVFAVGGAKKGAIKGRAEDGGDRTIYANMSRVDAVALRAIDGNNTPWSEFE